MKSALIGHTGFVGSNLAERHTFDAHFNSKNIQEIEGREFDMVLCAGVRAAKWIANQNSAEDIAQIRRLLAHFANVRAGRFVLISTVDVFGTPVGADEKSAPNPDCPYGEHRLFVEQEVSRLFPRVHIVRLPALFGKNIKKNVIYDLLNDNRLEFINPECRFQYYSLERLWRDVQIVVRHELPLVHLATEPVQTAQVVARAFADKRIGGAGGAPVLYDIKTLYAALFGGRGDYIENREKVLRGIERFAASYIRKHASV